MSSAQVSRFGSAREIDDWVAARYPATNRKWNANFQKYLRESAKEQHAKCKPDDGPSLQDFCAAFSDMRITFREYLRSTDAHKKKEIAACIADSLLAYRSSMEEREPPAKRTCTDTASPAMEQHAEQPANDPPVAPIDTPTPAKRSELDKDAAVDAAMTPPRGDGSGSGVAATPARPDTHLSPSAALRLSQSTRKSPLSEPGFAARSVDTPPQAEVARCQLAAIICAAETRLLEAAQKKVQQLYAHFKQKCVERGDDYVVPTRVDGKSNPDYNQKGYVRRAASELTAHDFQLLALLPRPQNVLGPEHYGEVEKCDGGYRWTFAKAGVPQCSEAFASQAAAFEALRWIQLELYPIWLNEADRENHIRYLMRRRTDEQQVAALANEPVLAFARAGLTKSISQPHASTSQRVDLRHDPLACGFANLGNTCYLNAVTQCLLHCRPFRHDLEATQQDGASFTGDKLKALFDVYKDGAATTSQVSPRLLDFVAQVLRQAGFAGGTQQDAAECLMHLLLSIDRGEMQQRVCGANAVASVESMILCEIADEAQVGDRINWALHREQTGMR